jgi:hypothetical protein
VRAIEVTELNTAPDKDFLQQMDNLQEYFDDPPDTTLLMHGIRHTSHLAQKLDLPRRFLELGAGISFPLTTAFKERVVDEALAIELNNKAVLKGRDIAADMGVYDQKNTLSYKEILLIAEYSEKLLHFIQQPLSRTCLICLRKKKLAILPVTQELMAQRSLSYNCK